MNNHQLNLFSFKKQENADVAKTVKAGTTGGSVRQGVRLPSSAPKKYDVKFKKGWDWSVEKQIYIKHKICRNNDCPHECTGLKKDGQPKNRWCVADCCYFCCHSFLRPGLKFCPCGGHVCWVTFNHHDHKGNKGCVLSYTYDLIMAILKAANPKILDDLTKSKNRMSNVFFSNHLAGVLKAIEDPKFNDPIKKRLTKREWIEKINAGN